MIIKDTAKLKENIDKIEKLRVDFSVKDAFSHIKVKDRKNVSGLFVHIEASHAGIINGNNFFYLPKGMKNGTKSFVEPFSKPVLVNHDTTLDPIGRVIASDYVSYEDVITPIMDSNYPSDVIEHIMDFVVSPTFTDKKYKGLGHLALDAEITDKEAINKILDKRYLTVSIGGSCQDVTCSKCGTNIRKEYDSLSAGNEPENDCMHELGKKYSDSEPPLFYIAGDMEFDEISYVSTPADPNAISRVANSKSVNDFRICDSKFNKAENTIHAYIKTQDNTTESTQKMKLKDFLTKSEDALALVKKVLKDMGLETLTLSDDKYSSLRKTSYLFADEKIVPIHDKAHVLAAYKILEDLEDEEGSKTLASAKALLDAKANRLFGDNHDRDEQLKIIVDEIAAAIAASGQATDTTTEEDKNKEKVTDNVDNAIVIDYEKLADLISGKLTSIIDTEAKNSYDFLLKRVSALETELEDSLNREKSVTDQIKNYIIDHILTIDQTETSDKLQERSIDSLTDKLKDLKEKRSSVTTPPGNTEGNNAEITDMNSGASDAGKSTVVKDGEGKPNGKHEYLDEKVVSVEYKRILKSTGLRAAAEYLDELRKTNKVHKDFKLY